MFKKFMEKFENFVEENRFSGVIIGFIFFVFILIFTLTKPYELFEQTLYDIRFKIKPQIEQWDYLTFLDLDNNSITQLGKFPWPRQIYPMGLEVMKEIGVRAAVFDIEFPDESEDKINNEAYDKLLKDLSSKKKINPDSIKDLIIESDAIFAEGIKMFGKAFLPYHFEDIIKRIDKDRQIKIDKAYKVFLDKASIKIPENKLSYYESLTDPARKSISFPIPEFTYTAHTFGFVDSDFDIDGVSRKIRLVRVFKGRMFFHMSLVMLMELCGLTKNDIEVIPGEKIVLKNAFNPVTQIKDDINIPINDQGMIYINWAGKFYETFNHVPFYALIEYPQIKEVIHDFFDKSESDIRNTTGKSERGGLYAKLDAEYEKYEKAKGTDAKQKSWSEINTIKNKIYQIEKGYAKPIYDDIARLKKELKEKEDPEKRKSLADLENYRTAIELVLNVERMKNHMALIGLTATATIDIGTTPLDNNFPMVGTYHNIVNTVLNKSFIHKTGGFINYTLIFIIAILISIFIRGLDARRSIMAIVFSLFFINLINIALFSIFNLLIDQLGSSLALLLPALAIAGIKFVTEENRRKFIKQAFGQYLSPHVIDQIIENPDSLKLGGEDRIITTFFSDVQGFSTISEKLTPSELVKLLNEYLSEMTDIVMKYEGTVDKFEGDAVMAFYGAPQELPDHAVKACLASIEMQEKLVDMRAVWKKQKRDELYVRIGMNTGKATVGNMGSMDKMDYTVMGDSVNLASRLEGANKAYGTYIMISETTYNEAKDFIEVRPLDKIRVVGKEEPIMVYEIMGRKGQLSDQVLEMLEKYNQGLEFFKERDWKKARASFRSGLKIIKDDGPCKTHYNRCTEFINNPPSKNWDGVFRLKSK